jgi:hypothetical protein
VLEAIGNGSEPFAKGNYAMIALICRPIAGRLTITAV